MVRCSISGASVLYKAEKAPLNGESTKIAALKNFFESDLINV